MRTRNYTLVLFALLSTSALSHKAAALNAITFTLDGSSLQGYAGNLGIDFNVNAPLTITQLGAFNATGQSFTTAKTVQVWNRNVPDTPLIQITIQPNQGTLLDGVRFVDVTPFTLPAGFQGTLCASGFNDIDHDYNTNVGSLNTSHQLTNDPLITWQDNGGGYVMNRYDDNLNRLPQVTNYQYNWQLPNASFRAHAASVPAPGSAALLSLGFAGVGMLLRRRR